MPHTVTCGIRLGVDALSNVHFLLNELALPPGCTREKPSIAKKPKVVPFKPCPSGFRRRETTSANEPIADSRGAQERTLKISRPGVQSVLHP